MYAISSQTQNAHAVKYFKSNLFRNISNCILIYTFEGATYMYVTATFFEEIHVTSRYSAKIKRDELTDRQTDGRGVSTSPIPGEAGDNYGHKVRYIISCWIRNMVEGAASRSNMADKY